MIMKKGFLAIVLLVVCGFLLSFINTVGVGPSLPIGNAAPLADLKMKGVDGKELSLNEAKTAKGLLVIFSCNTCPYVKLNESRIKEASEICAKQGLGCIIVNSNEAQRSEDDSFDEMVKYAQSQKFACAYVVDAGSKLANAFGATNTPQCFLFNAKGLLYKGAIDDNPKDPAQAKEHYLKDAIDALAKGTTPKTQEAKAIGCTIKRVE
jgi:thioredoxin-related protein